MPLLTLMPKGLTSTGDTAELAHEHNVGHDRGPLLARGPNAFTSTHGVAVSTTHYPAILRSPTVTVGRGLPCGKRDLLYLNGASTDSYRILR